jgi:hypothetical protein
MSLINDALKRAKQAQQNAPPPPVLQLRPIDPAPASSSRKIAGWLLAGAVALVAITALLFVGRAFQTGSSPQVVRAKTQPAVAEAAPRPVATPPAAPSVAPVAPAPVSPSAAEEAKPAQALPAAPLTPFTETNRSTEAAKAALPKAPAVEAPPPLRLQAIIFNPRHPSALISGRTVFLGDKFGDLRVTRISQTSVLLTGPGRTNLLELPQ